ncbi:MAG: hypothetical protein RI911_101 [Candidatus Parcubacteria bacterium]|jgi:hypothetical protein
MSYNSPESYTVIFESYSERHFIKSFEKKYHSAWEITREALQREFQSFDILPLRSIAECIHERDNVALYKTEFKVAGTKESRKTSGNRCIVAVHRIEKRVHVLLVYAKTDAKGARETDWWEAQIAAAYSQYRHLL